MKFLSSKENNKKTSDGFWKRVGWWFELHDKENKIFSKDITKNKELGPFILVVVIVVISMALLLLLQHLVRVLLYQ